MAERHDYTPEIKRQCVELRKAGKTRQSVYEEYFAKMFPDVAFETFNRNLTDWQHKCMTDQELMDAANLSYQFAPHASTVRVNGDGKIVEMWLKQHSTEDWDNLLEVIKANTEHVTVEPREWKDSHGMLEIPLFDMHFGVADLDYYRPALEELLGLINSHKWRQIVCVIGQDLLHNDDMRGRTSKGTPIEKVDMAAAWSDARAFWFNVIDTAIEQSESVKIVYSKGNHDESMSWAFVQMLRERYGEMMVDDSLDQWKAILWERVFVGVSHGDKGPAMKPAELVALFATKYPVPWAFAETREIHLGHLHTEADADPPGARVRRLGSGNKLDKWSDDNGFLGGQNRFSVFEWMDNRLKAIYFL